MLWFVPQAHYLRLLLGADYLYSGGKDQRIGRGRHLGHVRGFSASSSFAFNRKIRISSDLLTAVSKYLDAEF